MFAVLKEKIRLLDLDFSNFHLEAFSMYHTLLLKWSKRTNLLSKQDVGRIIERHFIDSLSLFSIFQFPKECFVIDIGTGAGFPGLPLSIVRPDLHMTLLDSKRMKVLFLKDVLANVVLPNVKVVCGRAETLFLHPDFRGIYDFVISRAVTQLYKLYCFAYPFLKPGGVIFAMKGGAIDDEVDDLLMKCDNVVVDIFPVLESFLPNSNKVIVRICMS